MPQFRHPRTRALVVGALAVPLLFAGCGDDDGGGDGVSVEGAWARTSPMMADAGAAYMELTSDADTEVIGVSVDAEVAGTAELHETVMAEGDMDGEMTDGDMDGEMTDGDMAEGDMAEGDMDGEMADGEMTDGDMAEGDMDGEMADGEMTDGDMAGGDMDGEMADGEMTDGDMADGDMADGEMDGEMDMGGAMTMQEVGSIALPAGETVSLEPGGYHVMLLDLVEPLELGDTFDVTLQLADGEELVVEVEVRDEAP